MRKEYRELNKIVQAEGGNVVQIIKKDKMDKVQISFGGTVVNYNFSTSKHCNFQKMVRTQWSCHGLVPVSFEQCLL